MFLYSKTIGIFLAKVQLMAKEILRQEMKINVKNKRFEYGKYRYPLIFVVFEKKNPLAYFDAKNFQIGLHKSLLFEVKDAVLRNILRHELAHYLCFLKYGDHQSHGQEFRTFCQTLGWQEEVFRSCLDVHQQNESLVGNMKNEAMIEKVKKLLSLASSSNVHEAELATLKANEILMKYHLNSLDSLTDDETFYIQRVLEGKRSSAKWRAISSILENFMVYPILNFGKGIVYLEVTGKQSAVEIAQYVANFLDQKLEELWKLNKKSNLKLQRHSFFSGLALGYNEKCEKIYSHSEKSQQKNITVWKGLLQKVAENYYHGFSSMQSSNNLCSFSLSAGKSLGKNLSISPAIKAKSASTLLLK